MHLRFAIGNLCAESGEVGARRGGVRTCIVVRGACLEGSRHLTPSQWVSVPNTCQLVPRLRTIAHAICNPKPATSQFPQRKPALRAPWSPIEAERVSEGRQRAHWFLRLIALNCAFLRLFQIFIFLSLRTAKMGKETKGTKGTKKPRLFACCRLLPAAVGFSRGGRV